MNSEPVAADTLAESVRAQVDHFPPQLLSPVAEAVVAVLRDQAPDVDGAALGTALMAAATAAASADETAGGMLTAKSMALAFALAGLRITESAGSQTAS